MGCCICGGKESVGDRIERVKELVGSDDFSVYDHRYNKIALTKREDGIASAGLTEMSDHNKDLVWRKLMLAPGARDALDAKAPSNDDGLGIARFLTSGDYDFTHLLEDSFEAQKALASEEMLDRIALIDEYEHYAGDGRGRRKYKPMERSGSSRDLKMGITQKDQMESDDVFDDVAVHGKGLKRRESHSDISELMFEQDMPFIGGVSGSTKEFIMNMEMTEDEPRTKDNAGEREIAIAGFMMCMVNGGHHSFGEMLITAKLLGYFPFITNPLHNYKKSINDFEKFAGTLAG